MLLTRHSGVGALLYVPLWEGACGVFSEICVNQCSRKTMEEEGSRKTPSSATRVVHAPPLHGGSDGFGVFVSVLVSLVAPLLCINVFV